jgi:sulfatase modifying factor 1
VGGSVRRWRAALAASILAIVTALVAGSCWNPLNDVLERWATLDMVNVQGGVLRLGDKDLAFKPSEQPPHNVQLSTFLMSRYEITQGLFEQIMGYNPAYFSPTTDPDLYPYDPNLPVERVTWLEAVQFCNLLSAASGFNPCYIIDLSTPGSETVQCDFTADGYRLPSEAEWEYAARGGADTENYLYAGSNALDKVAWCDDNPLGKTHPVGQLAANELGLYDMSGNVWEYCWDGWSTAGNYDFLWADPYFGIEPFVNPHGPFVFFSDKVWLDDIFVLRGGAWLEYGGYVGDCERVMARVSFYNAGAKSPPAADVPYWSYDTGFRVVRTQ